MEIIVKSQMVMLLAAILFVGGHLATRSSAQNQNGTEAPDTLSEEQIRAFTGQRRTPDGNLVRFIGIARQNNHLTPEQRQKHINAGTIPFRITADAFFVKTNERIDGDILFYILDQDGKVVDAGRHAVKQMCPT